jgi:hypothetical protein
MNETRLSVVNTKWGGLAWPGWEADKEITSNGTLNVVKNTYTNTQIKELNGRVEFIKTERITSRCFALTAMQTVCQIYTDKHKSLNIVYLCRYGKREGRVDFYNLCSSTNIFFWVIKSSRMIWVGHLARIRARRIAYRNLMGRPEKRGHLKDTGLMWEQY